MKLYLSIIAMLTLLFSCSEKEESSDVNPGGTEIPEDSTSTGLSYSDVYTDIASLQIIPAYANLENSLADFSSSLSALESEKTVANLNAAKTNFKALYLTYQTVTPFEFGPSADELYLKGFNLFPIDKDTGTVLSYVSSGDFGNARRVYGLPTLDYLLYAKGLDYISANDNAIRLMKEIVTKIDNKVSKIHNAWLASGDNYEAKFNSNVGTSANQSLSFLVNEVNKSFEFVKREKIGTPSGYFSSLGNTYPEFVEALYAGYSLELALANLEAVKKVFTGAGEGKGLNALLDKEGATSNGTALSEKLIAELDEGIEALKALNDPFSKEIMNNNAKTQEAAEQLQEVVPFMKNDVPQALDVAITYEDGDGD